MSGIYIHIPYCGSKCSYCNFYSLVSTASIDRYVRRLIEEIRKYNSLGISADTVYFGGGTPSCIGEERLVRLLRELSQVFSLSKTVEITCEVNPNHCSEQFFRRLREAGFNRISIGIQSADDVMLKRLRRPHNAEEAAEAVYAAQAAGFKNISADLMLALPFPSTDVLDIPGAGMKMSQRALENSLKLLQQLSQHGALQHVSAYILKPEPGTALYHALETVSAPKRDASLVMPDEEETARQYAFCIEKLEEMGFLQYEISNFAKPGFESRHNLCYWNCQEYLGFGPSAHSYFGGRRCYYPADLKRFLIQGDTVDDGKGGGFEEFAMLALRLKSGLKLSTCIARFSDGEQRFKAVQQRVNRIPASYLNADDTCIAIAPDGYMVSNSIIAELLL